MYQDILKNLSQNIHRLNQLIPQVFPKTAPAPVCFCVLSTANKSYHAIAPHNVQSLCPDTEYLLPEMAAIQMISVAKPDNWFERFLLPQCDNFTAFASVVYISFQLATDGVVYICLGFVQKILVDNRELANLSLLEATITTFLTRSYGVLFDLYDYHATIQHEMMQASGQLLTQAVFLAATGRKPDNVFEILIQVSLRRYEDNESSGVLMLISSEQDKLSSVVRFVHPFDLSDVQGIRKLVEMSSERLAMVCDGTAISGLDFIPDNPQGYSIHFIEHGVWEIRKANQPLLLVKYGQPQHPVPRLSKEDFIAYLQRHFPDNTSEDMERLWSIVSVAINQKKGTNILITSDAMAEAKRLSSQCTLVEPFLLSMELTAHVCGVDGTVIVDEHGYCHALSAILDGQVANTGRRQRGGRYNSAAMYYEQATQPCVILVVSQDGDINLFPPMQVSE